MKSKILALSGLIIIVFVSQAIWVTYSPILTNVATLIGTSIGLVGLLAIIYPIVFLVMTIPAGLLLDKNFKLWLSFGSILTFAGGALRIVLPHTYISLLTFQLLGAIGQPFLLNSFALFASKYYEKRKSLVISVLSFSMYLGTIFALGAGEFFYKSGGLYYVFLPTAVLSVVGIVLYLAGLNKLEGKQSGSTIPTIKGMKFAIKQRNLWVLGIILGLGVAAFDNLSTWLQPVLQTINLGGSAGTVVALTLIVGLVGILILPTLVSKMQFRTFYLRGAALAVLLIFVTLGFLTSRVTLYFLLPVGGLVMLPAYPIINEWISKFYSTDKQGVASGFMAFVSRVLSVVFTLSALVVLSTVEGYFLFLAVLILGAAIFTFLLPMDKGVPTL
jgi:major facilitator 4 family protein